MTGPCVLLINKLTMKTVPPYQGNLKYRYCRYAHASFYSCLAYPSDISSIFDLKDGANVLDPIYPGRAFKQSGRGIRGNMSRQERGGEIFPFSLCSRKLEGSDLG